MDSSRKLPYISGMSEKPLQRGRKIIEGHVANLPATPGVYRMLDGAGEALYVGKAKALKKRVASYTKTDKLPIRLQRMVALTHSMEFVYTQTEVEALLLEANLIKKLKPKYNILLRDDKSFPYIHITGHHDFAQIQKFRGARKKGKEAGEYFGPFASAGAVNRTIETLQRAFKLRNCSDNVFKGRTRPCLQYHIKRCTAPCVGKISKEDYAADVEAARDFLTGKSKEIQGRFAARMEVASEAMDFEKAAEYRDRIKALSAIQAVQDINMEGIGNADVMGIVRREGKSCVQVFFFRGGQNFGNRAYYPVHDAEETDSHILSVFIAQLYQSKPVPKSIYVNVMPDESKLLEEALAAKDNAPDKITIQKPSRGKRKNLVAFVMKNASDALSRQIALKSSEIKMLQGVADLFGLEESPNRIEVYDNSHISGSNMVGAMIVAGPDGFDKSAYRKFNIREADKADDYGMMREVMQRRFKAFVAGELQADSLDFPDLLLIDGGKGQLSAVKETLLEMGVWEALTVVSIAKGPDRNAGREQFFVEGKKPFQLPVNDAALHYLQRLRDEAHRFAIGAHRKRRAGDIVKSPLDEIGGIGPSRKKALLQYFGSAKGVAGARVEDLQKVEGISRAMAEKIYGHFHEK